MQTVSHNTWVQVGVRVILKKAIAKALRGDDKRTGLLFNELATESLLEFARGTFRREVEAECLQWIHAAAMKRAQVLALSLAETEREFGKALAEADLMNRQAHALLGALEK